MADVLIVDDEADIRDLISDLLTDEGYSARTAEDADSAFAAIEVAPPDLIILDIWLQGSRMDGIEVLKSVKRDNPGIPVVDMKVEPAARRRRGPIHRQGERRGFKHRHQRA